MKKPLGPYSEGEIHCNTWFNVYSFHSEGRWYNMNDKGQFPKREKSK